MRLWKSLFGRSTYSGGSLRVNTVSNQCIAVCELQISILHAYYNNCNRANNGRKRKHNISIDLRVYCFTNIITDGGFLRGTTLVRYFNCTRERLLKMRVPCWRESVKLVYQGDGYSTAALNRRNHFPK